MKWWINSALFFFFSQSELQSSSSCASEAAPSQQPQLVSEQWVSLTQQLHALCSVFTCKVSIPLTVTVDMINSLWLRLLQLFHFGSWDIWKVEKQRFSSRLCWDSCLCLQGCEWSLRDDHWRETSSAHTGTSNCETAFQRLCGVKIHFLNWITISLHNFYLYYSIGIFLFQLKNEGIDADLLLHHSSMSALNAVLHPHLLGSPTKHLEGNRKPIFIFFDSWCLVILNCTLKAINHKKGVDGNKR